MDDSFNLPNKIIVEIETMNLEDRAKKKIFHENATRLLNL